jgi:hypothetical protein
MQNDVRQAAVRVGEPPAGVEPLFRLRVPRGLRDEKVPPEIDPGAAVGDGQLPGGQNSIIQCIRVCYEGRGRNEGVFYEVFIRIGGVADYGYELSIGCDGQTNQ